MVTQKNSKSHAAVHNHMISMDKETWKVFNFVGSVKKFDMKNAALLSILLMFRDIMKTRHPAIHKAFVRNPDRKQCRQDLVKRDVGPKES